VQVINARFEDWTAPEPFDLALAIPSWPWLDPAVRYQMAAAALKPGAILALSISEQAFLRASIPFSSRYRMAMKPLARAGCRGRRRTGDECRCTRRD
jgi:hypothetical protein